MLLFGWGFYRPLVWHVLVLETMRTFRSRLTGGPGHAAGGPSPGMMVVSNPADAPPIRGRQTWLCLFREDVINRLYLSF